MKIDFTKAIMMTVLITVLTHPIFAQEPFVTFIEYTEEGTSIELPKIQFQHHVDINSYIDVRFHPNTLALDDSNILSSLESDRLRQELEHLNKLLTKARDELNEYVRSIGSLRVQLLKGADPEVEARFRKKLKGHGLLIEKLLDILGPIEEGRLLEQALSTSDPVYADVVSLLAEHIKNVQQELHAETSLLIQNNELTFNVWCIHTSGGKEPTAIHLNNYDNLRAGSFHIVDKDAFARTEDEDGHLKESVRFHEDLRKLIEDIGNKQSEIRQVFRELRDQFFSDLKGFENLFGTQELQSLLDELDAEINKLSASTKIEALKTDLTKLRTELKEFFNLKEQNASLVEELSRRRDPNPLVLFELLSERINRFEELKNRLDDIAKLDRINKIRQVVEDLETTLEEMPTSIPPRLRKTINELVKEKSQVWIASFSNLKEILKKYESFSDYKNAFRTLAERKSFVTTISDEVPDPGDLMPKEIREVAFSEAPPTVINIPRTGRQENDIYNLYAQIYRKGSPTLRREYSFRIRKYGTYSRWTGNLIFAKGEWQKSFQPATSISWILHYRSRPKQRNGKIEGGGGILGNVLNLGFGLNSVVFSTGGSIEYGLGFTVTFLSDILQIGYGINFQKANRRGYFFIGASLFDLLNQTRSEL